MESNIRSKNPSSDEADGRLVAAALYRVEPNRTLPIDTRLRGKPRLSVRPSDYYDKRPCNHLVLRRIAVVDFVDRPRPRFIEQNPLLCGSAC